MNSSSLALLSSKNTYDNHLYLYYSIAGLNDKKTEESSLYCCYEHQPSVAIIFIATTFLVI